MNLGVLPHRTSLGHLSYQGSPSLSRQIIFIWPSIDLIIQPFYYWALVLLKFSELEVGDSMMMLFLIRSYFTEPRVELHLFIQFSSVKPLSWVWLFATPWTAAHQASLSITNFRSLLKLMSIESVMPSNHLILCRPLLLPPSIFPSIRVFSNESVLRIRWPNYTLRKPKLKETHVSHCSLQHYLQ